MKYNNVWLIIQYKEWENYLSSIKDTKSVSYIYAKNQLLHISKQLK